MQAPYMRTPISKCIELGAFSKHMLGKVPDNPVLAPLSEQMGASTLMLIQAQSGHEASVLKLTEARAEVQFAQYSANRYVRGLSRTLEIADGVRKGRLSSTLLPEGVTAIARLAAVSKATELRALEGRLEAMGSQWEGAASEKAKLASERQRLEAAIALRRSAEQSAEDMRARRDAAKQQFLDAYAQVTAGVKAAFPRNRPMQDLFFDEIPDRGSADKDADELDVPMLTNGSLAS